MSLTKRKSPKGKPVSLFVTCMVDMLSPQTGLSVVDVLEHLGVTVEFPAAQTCCGQPAFNAGYRPEARRVVAAALIALVLILPNLTWQYTHDFPVWTHMQELAAYQLGNVTLTGFLLDQLLMNFPGLVLWLGGLGWLFVRRLLVRGPGERAVFSRFAETRRGLVLGSLCGGNSQPRHGPE